MDGWIDGNREWLDSPCNLKYPFVKRKGRGRGETKEEDKGKGKGNGRKGEESANRTLVAKGGNKEPSGEGQRDGIETSCNKRMKAGIRKGNGE